MNIVSVINYKGGVGKTSLTANLGAELAWRGKRVLLIDLDAQASLTFSFIKPDSWLDDYEKNKTIKTWFDSNLEGGQTSLSSLIQTPSVINGKLKSGGKLDIIFSHLGLINVDLELATKLGGSNLKQAKKNFISVHKKLSDGLQVLKEDPFFNYDLVLIDCPPNFNIVTKTAIIASDHILVPTRPDELSTLGIDYLVRSISSLVGDYNDYLEVDTSEVEEKIQPAVMGVVFTMIQEYDGGPIAAQKEYIAKVKRAGIHTVFDSYVKRNDTVFASAPAYGIPVVLNGYNSQSHQSVVDSLELVTDEFMAMIGL
jgi:chromosome partitioning protein